ncbi:MAG: EAL domain-containing protein [Desulfuromonadaceae bacterium]|nr:EAL domain-containing protein [Desulfuromonadaceae bacterium]
MACRCRLMKSGYLPLLATLFVVSSVFGLILYQGQVMYDYELETNQQILNMSAKRELGDLLLEELSRLHNDFLQLLVEANDDRQSLIIRSSYQRIHQLNHILTIIADGGTLIRELPLNLPQQNQARLSLSYRPVNPNEYHLDVLTLRPQLVSVQQLISETIDKTRLRNQLLVSPQPGSARLKQVALELREHEKKVTANFERLLENANRIVLTTNQQLERLREDLSIAKYRNFRNRRYEAGTAIFAVFILIFLIFRSIRFSHRCLEDTVSRLEQAEEELQLTNEQITALNLSLEKRVADQTRELRQSEILWDNAFNAIAAPALIHDRQGNLIKANRAYLREAGAYLSDVVGKPYWQFFPHQETPIFAIDSVQRNHRIHIDDLEICDRIYRVRSFPVLENGENYLCTIMFLEDVTERRQFSQQLQRSETRFREITDSMSDVLIMLDQQLNIQLLNRAAREAYHVDDNDYFGKSCHSIFWDCTDPCEQCPALDVMRDGEIKKALRYRDDGRILDRTIYPVYDNEGIITGCAVVAQDVTEQHKQQAKLRLAEKVFKNTTEGITITDEKNRILAVNEAFSTITGYSEEEAIGQTPALLKSGQHNLAFYQQMWQELQQNGHWSGELWNRRKNGEIYRQRLTISTVVDKGEVVNYVGVFSDVTPMWRSAEKLDYLAHHHPLTGLPNRIKLQSCLQQMMTSAGQHPSQGAILYLDLDNFKKINDSLGHHYGDLVLKEVAERLHQLCQQQHCQLFHLNADEFVIVFALNLAPFEIDGRVQSILKTLDAPFHFDGYELFISASIGIADLTSANDEQILLKNADLAMHQSQKSGKNTYRRYSSELAEQALERMQMETALRNAIRQNELEVYYQPQLDVDGQTIIAAEALLRWFHPVMGSVAPDRFIPLSEETGLILEIGEWVMEQACRQFVQWQDEGIALRRMAVNLSGRQIQLNQLAQTVENVLKRSGCPGHCLELEITEGFIMQQPEASIELLNEIRRLGVELSVDDFGTGHSSLNYLKKLPIHRLKIDRSFVWDIEKNSDGEQIVRAIIAIGRSLNLNITAEGVETEAQRAFLHQEGCDELQGYLFSKPLTAAEFAAYYPHINRPSTADGRGELEF